MLGQYYYHEIIRKTIISFGTLFNSIELRHTKQDGSEFSTVKVPIAYGPSEKFIARLEQKPDPRRRVSITLPRLAFELTGIQYDNSRKVSTMQTFKTFTNNGTKLAKKVYMPVPYNLGFSLSILTQYNEDAMQIIEQILPLFQPSFNVTVDLVDSIGEKRDVPLVLENINFQDNYTSGYEEKRVIIHNLQFTAKTYIFGAIADNSEGLIRKVQVDYHTTTNRKTAKRELRYVAEPRALKDYNDDNATTLAEDINAEQTKFLVTNASSFVVDGYIYIGKELMQIREISNETLLVHRGVDGTQADSHIKGISIDAVTQADDDLVEPGDDFGFSEERFDFGDFRTYSPTKGTDV
tara:strand:+ start:2009 stop:3061 length:1053 start_codon:yes stop_codon:yes gene_type:complete